MYRVELTKKALKSLKKIDKKTQAILFSWIEKHLENCTNPYQYGRALVGNRIADIQEDKILILVLEIGHRKSIYGGH